WCVSLPVRIVSFASAETTALPFSSPSHGAKGLREPIYPVNPTTNGRFWSTSGMAKPRTLYDKIWDDHLVDEEPGGTCLIYIDRHLVHEVTSPQAFEGLRLAGR